jgi:hypothetical protein
VSSISSKENITKLQLQNISYIVTGSVDAVSGGYLITVKMLDVSTGQFSHSDDESMESRELISGVRVLANRFIAGMSGEEGRAAQVEPPKGGGSEVYKIGGRGPAGGIVFYDKGVFSNGWRYLEAASAETEFANVEWGAYNRRVSGTSEAVGSGKRNTQLIVERLKQLGEGGKAAQLCAGLEINGYKDWFLPSKDELNLMYQNLHKKGLGGFSGYYWSSSQYNTYSSWSQYFSNGHQFIYSKYDTGSVRAARAF